MFLSLGMSTASRGLMTRQVLSVLTVLQQLHLCSKDSKFYVRVISMHLIDHNFSILRCDNLNCLAPVCCMQRSMLRLQGFALTSYLSVQYPANYQTAVDNLRWTLFQITSPFDSLITSKNTRAATAAGGSPTGTAGAVPAMAPASGPSSHQLFPPPAGVALKAELRSAANVLASTPAAPPTTSAASPAPSAGPALAPAGCNGGVGLSADGSCSELQSLAASNYVVFTSDVSTTSPSGLLATGSLCLGLSSIAINLPHFALHIVGGTVLRVGPASLASIVCSEKDQRRSRAECAQGDLAWFLN